MKNKKRLKIQVGLIGITRRENSRNNFFLIPLVFSKIEKELREILKETKIHHLLNQNKTNIQSKNIVSWAATFDREDITTLYNI